MRPSPTLTALSTVFLTAMSLTASIGSGSHPPKTPLEVVAMINGQVMPRFQVDAGLFGMDRQVTEASVHGHPAADFYDLLDYETTSDRAVFANVQHAPYFVILGVMHVRHKPGSIIGEIQDDNSVAKFAVGDIVDGVQSTQNFVPSSDQIEASGTTTTRACRTFAWAESNIQPATIWAYSKVRKGMSVNSTYGKFFVALRPIKATKQ